MVSFKRPRRVWNWVSGLGVNYVLILGFLQMGFSPIDAGQIEVPGPKGKKPTVEELRSRYPFKSLSERLQYEEEAAKDADAQVVPPLAKEVAEKLKKADQVHAILKSGKTWWGPRRLRALQELHSNEAQKFIDREGNGLERMPRPRRIFLELPPGPTLPFGSVSYSEATLSGEPRVNLPAKGDRFVAAGRLPSLENLAFLHDSGLHQFLNPDSLGYIKDRDNVAGFEPHQFRQALELPRVLDARPGEPKNKERWVMRRLELVSLLKSATPAVYLSEELPKMENLKRAPKRALDSFEEQGLKKLRDGQDVVTEATTNRIRMLGALRASQQCLECHRARKHGGLLGAFSYELLRDPKLAAE